MSPPLLQLENLSKRFTLHHQHGTALRVLERVHLSLCPGECLVLDGPSGMGKSTLLKLIYANYQASGGSILLTPPGSQPLELTTATPRELLAVRRDVIGYVSQFLRVIPRVSAVDVVAESLMEDAPEPAAALEPARDQARAWLKRLRIPERLWDLPPATFSGGEQQRVNIARSMIKPKPLLLLDEPTASLDAANTQTVVELIREALARGAAVLGIFHDTSVAASVATRRLEMAQFRSAA